jgi:hypothetical protein
MIALRRYALRCIVALCVVVLVGVGIEMCLDDLTFLCLLVQSSYIHVLWVTLSARQIS